MTDLPPSEHVRAALYAAVVRQSTTVDNANDLLVLAQTWSMLTAVEEEEPDEYIATTSATMLGQSEYWDYESRDPRRRLGF